MDTPKLSHNNTKKIFKERGTCSQTFCHILNQEFGASKDAEERALDPLAGGILNYGHQCGMLWGTILAAGAEAFRKYQDIDQAIAATVKASQEVVASFEEKTKTLNCREIINCNLNNWFGMTKYMLKIALVGMENSTCFNLAEDWAPDAIHFAKKGLSEIPETGKEQVRSCASEVIRRMGATREESIWVAGFSGGLGLSGHACGALAAAIWFKTLAWCKEHPGENPPYFNNPPAKALMKKFQEATNEEMLCANICGQRFKDIDEHTTYLNEGGCAELMEVLAEK